MSIDTLAYSSRFRQMSPCLKTAFTLAVLFLGVWAQSLMVSVLIWIMMGILVLISGGVLWDESVNPIQKRAFLKFCVKLMLIPLFILLPSVITIAIQISPYPLPVFAIPFFRQYLTSSWESIVQGIRLAVVSYGAVSCLYFLSLTTPVTDLLEVLQAIHCPSLIAELFLLTYRFIFLLMESAISISTAQKCRLGNRNFRTTLRCAADQFAMVFVLAYQKISFLYDAMESRCYNGKIQVLRQSRAVRKSELGLAVILFGFLGAVAILEKLFFRGG